MYSRRRITCTVCLILGLLLASKPGRADFFDWIMGTEPTPWSTTTGEIRSNRLFSWRPTTTLSSGQSVAEAFSTQQAVVNYAPVTRYRTQWVQVPVTTYRPVFEANPQTGWPELQMRACYRFMWQVRRVPVTVMRPLGQTGPFFNRGCLFPCCWNWTPWVNNCCVPPQGQYGTTTTINSQPYYSGSDAGQPVLAIPPSTNIPTGAGEAADQTPTLPSTNPQGAANNNENDSAPNLSTTDNQSRLRRPVNDADLGLEPSIPRVITPPKTIPIPDLDRQPLLQNQGPRLLDPQDRTTKTLPRTWKDNTIQWASLPRATHASPSAGKVSSQLIRQPSDDLPAPLRWERVRP